MAKDKVTLVVPNEDNFKPAPIPFGVVVGEGVDNYNEDGKEYSVSIILDKKMAKDIKKEVMDFWDENKPSGAGDEPANIDGIVRKGKDDYEGTFILYAKTQTHFGDKPNQVAIVNHEGTKLDPEEFGLIGKGSEGRLAVTLAIYVQGKKKGVSVFLSAVKLTKFVKYESSGGASAFGGNDEGEVSGEGGFKSEKKKDKKSKKPKHDEPEDDDDGEEVEAPKKAKKEKKKKKHVND